MLSSFYPVVPGRTSDSQRRTRSLYQLQVDQAALTKLQEQISTGKRFLKASEDPSAAIRVIGIQKSNEFKVQALQNLKSSESFLNVAETTLSETQSLVIEARSLALEANTNILSDSEREGIASQIDAILQRIVNSSNTQFQDRFLLAGGSVSTQPISRNGNFVRFAGDDLNLLSAADESDFIAHNITAQRALGVTSSSVVSTIDLNPGVRSTTRLDDLNGGDGVSPGVLEFSDGVNQFALDIAGAETLGDIVERVNQVSLGGRSLSATLTGTGLQIDFQDGNGGTLRISDLGVGNSARDLGILSTVPSPPLPIVGNELDPILRRTTQISQLSGGAGFDLQGGIVIRQGTRSHRIELSNANTIEDILNAVQRSGAAVRADITPDGRSLQIRSVESGTDFTINEADSDLATRLGLRTFTASTRLDQLNYGRGVRFGTGTDLTFERIDGTELKIDLDGAVTIQDVIDRINLNVGNQSPANQIVASVNPVNNGLRITSTTTGALQPFKVRASGGSEVAWNLGLVPIGDTESVSTDTGTDYVLTGQDPNPQEVSGVFNTLIRLRDSIVQGDLPGIDRAIQLIDGDLDRLSLTRGELGVRLQRVERLKETNESVQIELKRQESDLSDVDLAQAISDLTARQAAQQASLSLLAQTAKLSLFDFL